MDLSEEFQLQDDLLYLNHAAVSPWPRRTAQAVAQFANENVRQGSLAYPHWLETEKSLRDKLRQLINAPSVDDIALVKNTSEALSFVASGIDWHAGENIVSSDEEFPSNRIVWEALSSSGVELRRANLAVGDSPEASLFAMVDEHTRMIAISSVQYATGLRLDLERIGEFCRENSILFCVDAIQQIGALPLDVQTCHADFVCADGHKWMLGPEGLGLFYCRQELRERLELHQFGWHMVEHVGDFERDSWQPASSARRFECGSPNMLSIHALDASLSLLLEYGVERVAAQVLDNSRFILEQLNASGFISATPADPQRHAGIVSFAHTNGEGKTATIFSTLQENRLFCALRGGNIRFSPHFYTPREKLERAMTLVQSATQSSVTG